MFSVVFDVFSMVFKVFSLFFDVSRGYAKSHPPAQPTRKQDMFIGLTPALSYVASKALGHRS